MEPCICLALDDLDTLSGARSLIRELQDRLYAVKIHDMYDWFGPDSIQKLKEAGAERVWVDHKLHDTPDTVALRTKDLIENGADIVTVHASGGERMLQKAVEAARRNNEHAEVWAVTILSSLGDEEVREIYGRSPEQASHWLAWKAQKAGVRGLVSSAQEVGSLAKIPGLSGMRLVVPGTRSINDPLGPHKRSGTPAYAIENGATIIVAGRQVTEAPDPIEAFDALEVEIELARSRLRNQLPLAYS